MYHSYSNLEQQFLNGSMTGGPRVPVAVHPMISNAYVSVLPQDQFINNWETTNLRTISGMHNASPGAADHMFGYGDSISAFTASTTGSLVHLATTLEKALQATCVCPFAWLRC